MNPTTWSGLRVQKCHIANTNSRKSSCPDVSLSATAKARSMKGVRSRSHRVSSSKREIVEFPSASMLS